MQMDERTMRVRMLIGDEAQEKLRHSRVAVFGLGGVGSWCAEALCRTGIGELTIVDSDCVSATNINRQAGALVSTVGQRKTEAMARRLMDINPELRLHEICGLYSADSREDFISDYDYIADAIDLVSCKVDLIQTAMERGIPIISALGTGNKTDAAQLEICDISKTHGCPLARVVRKELRARGIEHHEVVFSPEEGLTPAPLEAPPPGRRSVPGSLMWVPASAGLLMCQHIVMKLIKD
jgi:tRNA A37 threonylcarbamoyladenosine dehydratase